MRLSLDAGRGRLSVRDGPAVAARPGGHGGANIRCRAEAVGGALHHVAEASGFAVVACRSSEQRARPTSTSSAGPNVMLSAGKRRRCHGKQDA